MIHRIPDARSESSRCAHRKRTRCAGGPFLSLMLAAKEFTHEEWLAKIKIRPPGRDERFLR